MSKLFWAMLSFITRLPVPRRWSQGLDFEHYSRGIITFPLIGLPMSDKSPITSSNLWRAGSFSKIRFPLK